MSAKMECLTCNGQGWIEDVETVARCCGGSDWECGARGCTGPIPEHQQIQIGCDDCQGTGFNLPERVQS